MFDTLPCLYHHFISLMRLFVIHHTDIIFYLNCFTFYYTQVGAWKQFSSSHLAVWLWDLVKHKSKGLGVWQSPVLFHAKAI